MDGEYFCYTALPFGLAIAPWIFTKLMRVVAKFLRAPRFQSGSYFSSKFVPKKVIKKGFKCLVYLDDVLVLMRKNGFADGRIALLR